jgi:hypothetical protein
VSVPAVVDVEVDVDADVAVDAGDIVVFMAVLDDVPAVPAG